MLTQKTQKSIVSKSNIGVRRNTWIFYILRLDLMAMCVPVIVKLWEEASLVFNQMLLLQGIFALSIVLAEIPSGAISDAFKRKYVLAFGYGFLGFACITYGLGTNFAIFAISEIIFGVGRATISGSDTGLIYDTLKNSEQEAKYKTILGRAGTFTFIIAMISLPIAGVISLYSLRWPFFIIAITLFVKAVLSLFMVEVERTKAQSMKKATYSALSLLRKSRFLIAVLIAFVSYSIAQRVVFWAYQPKLFQNEITTFHISLIFAGMNMIAAISSTVLSKIKDKHEDVILVGFLLLELANLIIVMKFNSLIILTTMLLVQVSRGGRVPIIGTMIQRKASSDLRATIISLYSTIGNLLYFIISLLYTLLNVSIDNTLLSMLVFSIILFVLYLSLVWMKNNGKEKKEE